MQDLLIIGSTGLLGSYLWKTAQSRYNLLGIHYGESQFPDESTELDITRKQSITKFLEDHRPNHVILTSAMTNVDYAEEHPREARALNTEAPANIAKVCARIGAHLIYISTDFVFDGNQSSYVESDTPNPLSVYGQTKYEGEIRVQQNYPAALIARSCVLYGVNPPERRQNYVSWVLSSLREEKHLRIVTDQYNTPTYAGDLALILLRFLNTEKSGIFHTCGSECLSRYDFALKIAKEFNLSRDLITPITSVDLMQKAKRPKWACLSTAKLQEHLEHVPFNIAQGLRAIKEELKYNNATENAKIS